MTANQAVISCSRHQKRTSFHMTLQRKEFFLKTDFFCPLSWQQSTPVVVSVMTPVLFCSCVWVLVSYIWFTSCIMSCVLFCFLHVLCLVLPSPCLVSLVLIFHALMCPLSSPLWLPLSVVLFPPGLFLCAPPPHYHTWFPSSSLLTCASSCR